MKVFITGDRRFAAVYPTLIMLEAIRALGKGATIVTGTFDGGVEQVLRDILETAGVVPQIVEHSLDENGKPNFWDYAQVVGNDDDVVEIVVIHADPHASSVTKTFLAAAEAKTRLATPADLLQ